jgi:hypothetical protein
VKEDAGNWILDIGCWIDFQADNSNSRFGFSKPKASGIISCRGFTGCLLSIFLSLSCLDARK